MTKLAKHVYHAQDCTALVQTLLHSYESGQGTGIIDFEGDELTFDGFGEPSGLMIVSPVFTNWVFFIDEDWQNNDDMILSVFRGPVVLTDQTIGIRLPKSKYSELYYTLTGGMPERQIF